MILGKPEWNFVFVGEINSSHSQILDPIRQLSKRSNVTFLGGKTSQDLAGYPQHFDVCVMPYKMYPYTNYIYPMKLHEYLASGRPVVGTPIRSLAEFSRVIQLAGTAHEWSSAIERALSLEENSKEKIEVRQQIARQFDWNNLVTIITRTVCERLGESDRARPAHGGPR